MGSPQKPIPDALVFRETPEGTEWFVRRIPAHKLAVFLEGGWKLLISSSQVAAVDLEDTYRADLRGPFNPPRTP
jgi:hypothetical protein